MEATWQSDAVPDRHRDPTVTVRPTADAKADAEEVLGRHGWTMQEYLLACIGELLTKPATRVRAVERWRPEKKPIGRPRKTRGEG